MAAASEGVGDAAGRRAAPAPAPARRAPAPAPARRRRLRRERHDVRLAGRRADRLRARRRPEPGPGHRPRRPRDEEGHPRRSSSPALPRPLPRRPLPSPRQPARQRRTGCPAPPPPLHRDPHRSPARRATAPPAPPRRRSRRSPPRRPSRRRDARADDRDAQRHRRAHAPLARHRPRTSRARSRSTCRKVVAIRAKLKKEYQKSYGVNPTYLAFVARAAVETLREYPWINGELRGDKIVTRNYVNLGFAVELADGKGLIVPVVKNAETLNLLGMAKRDHRHRRSARATRSCMPGRRPGRHVHDHEPRRLRHVPRHAGDQPAAGRRSSAPTPSSSGRGSCRTSSART